MSDGIAHAADASATRAPSALRPRQVRVRRCIGERLGMQDRAGAADVATTLRALTYPDGLPCDDRLVRAAARDRW